jgi:molybdopterin adenylyltransferase
MAYDQHKQAGQTVVARCAVITLSDTRTKETDTSGKLIVELLQQAGHALISYDIIPDDPRQLESLLESLTARQDLDAILTTGGTGISKRDQTIDVVEQLITQPLPGFGELFRMLSWEQIGSGAMLSRAVGGIINGKLIVAIPGSSKAVDLAMTKLILPEIRHLIFELKKNA